MDGRWEGGRVGSSKKINELTGCLKEGRLV